MLQAIEGIYKNGSIELTEAPQGISESRVIVTFLEAQPPLSSQQMIGFGMFAGNVQSTEYDFQIAEFHGGGENLEPV